MQIIAKRTFVASTAVPLVEITFDVYAQNQHFEVVFKIKDDASKKVIAQNLKKAISNLLLVESELTENEFLIFLSKAVSVFDHYRGCLFDIEEIYETSQIDFLKMIMQEIALHKAKRAKKSLKK